MKYLDSNFEDYCSSKFFDSKHQTTGKALFSKAQKGDKDALAIFEEFGSHIGNLIVQILYILAPERVIIGGSIAKSSEFFLPGIQKEVNKFPVELIRNSFEVEIAHLQHPGILGAAALCYQAFD